MKRVPLKEIRSKLDTINGICAYNGADYSSNYTYYTANYSSNNGVRGTYRGAYTSNSTNRSGAGSSRS